MGGDQQKKKREKQDKLDAAVYALRQKMGGDTITLGFQKNDDIPASPENLRLRFLLK